MNVNLAAVIIIGGAMIVAILGLLATRRVVKLQLSEGHNDIAGFVFATVGVVYLRAASDSPRSGKLVDFQPRRRGQVVKAGVCKTPIGGSIPPVASTISPQA